MGHYRSEMYSDKELDEQEQSQQRRFNTRKTKIEAAIEENGIAFVLAEILDEPIYARIEYS